MACAAGTQTSGAALLTAVHLEGCTRCQGIVRDFEHVAGSVLADQPSAELPPGLFARVMARVDHTDVPKTLPRVEPRPELPPGVDWPRSMRHCRISRWRVLGPGLRWSRVRLPDDPSANVVLLRIGAGKCLPPHTHSGVELTQVLVGAFDDGRTVFAAGDFDATDGSVHHQPVVQASAECICLGAVDGRLVFDSLLARWAGALVGL